MEYSFRRAKLNVPMVARLIGFLLIGESAFMAIPTISAWLGDGNDEMAFLITTLATFVAGVCMAFLTPGSNRDMGKREGFLLTALVWVFFSAFGMIPFIIGSPGLNLSDAFFESMSGFTTTGASILNEQHKVSSSIYLWRSLMQWIGGMGIILFTLAVIPMLNSSGGMQMFNAEVTGINHEKLKPRVSQTAKRLWGLYVILTFVLVLLLWIGPMDFFDAICHALSTMSTGGYTTADAAHITQASFYVKLVITAFMFVGGINFALLYKVLSGHFKDFIRNDALRVYAMAIGAMYFVFVLYLAFTRSVESVSNLLVDPLFQIVSTMSTTGYLVEGFRSWGTPLLLLMFVMMFFGACAGSTSGGAKLDRGVYLVKSIKNEISRTLHPNTIMPVRINGKATSPELVSKVMAFLCIYMLLIVVGGLCLTFFNVPFVDALFDSFSCISNTGLGAGVTGYGSDYSIVPVGGKIVLSLLMLIGRLELFTVLVLFTPGFWNR